MDIRLALMTGVDIPVPECQVAVHQPTIKEISYIGEKDFFTGIQTICIYKSMFTEGKDVLGDVDNFQIFMTVMNDKETKEKKESVKKLMALIFPNSKPLFTPQSIVLSSSSGESTMIDGTNFESLQEILRLIFCAKNGPMDQQAFNPADEKAREIAEKLMRGRQRVAAQKGEQNTSVFSLYLSMLSIGNKMDINQLTNCTMFQLYDLVERYSLYMNWDIDLKVRLAGGKPDSQVDNWMKNIH